MGTNEPPYLYQLGSLDNRYQLKEFYIHNISASNVRCRCIPKSLVLEFLSSDSIFVVHANRGTENLLMEIIKLKEAVGQRKLEKGCMKQACITGRLCEVKLEMPWFTTDTIFLSGIRMLKRTSNTR